MRTRVLFLAAALCGLAAPASGQEPHEHPDCPDPGTAFWMWRLSHWHYPDVVAELTQRNGPRSEAELDAVARELVRSAPEPDGDAVAEHIRAHFEGDIRAGAEEAARAGICYDERDVDRMVVGVIEHYRDSPDGIARRMVGTTLQLAAHRGWRSPLHPPYRGVPYDGDGAFEAALLLREGTGSDAFLLHELNPERAWPVFERDALRPGPRACDALKRLRIWHWDESAERYDPHPSYERLRRASPERCPELDVPDD